MTQDQKKVERARQRLDERAAARDKAALSERRAKKAVLALRDVAAKRQGKAHGYGDQGASWLAWRKRCAIGWSNATGASGAALGRA
jgi:hypothetical protein